MVVSLKQIKGYLDAIYGFDIAQEKRDRSIVYARKVFINIAHRYGYSWIEMEPVIRQKHDTCIYHVKTFSAIKPMDLHVYNACVDALDLPVQKYNSVTSIDANTTTNKIVDELMKMSRKDIKYFHNKIWLKYLTNLAHEKSFIIENLKLN